MIDLRFKPLPEFPGEITNRFSPFKMRYEKTLDLLEYELRRIEAKSIVIEAGFDYDSLRNDGWPRPGRNPKHPGIVLHFTSKDGPLRFPCGTYSRWTANLHAIALTLESLRAIDRYGVTVGHQQYVGFMLEAPGMNVDQAAQWLADVGAGVPGKSKEILESGSYYHEALRVAARRTHPDTCAGDRAQWEILEQARRLLDEHHGFKKPAAL